MLIAALGGIGWLAFARSEAATGAVVQAHDVTETANAVGSRLSDAQAAQRGYLISGAADYLEHYTAAQRDVPGRIAKLRTLTAGQPVQTRLVDELSTVANLQLSDLQTAVAARARTSTDSVRPPATVTPRSVALADSATALISSINAEARAILETRTTSFGRIQTIAKAVILAGVVLGLAVAFLAGSIIARTTQAAERLRGQLAVTAAELQRTTVAFERRSAEVERLSAESQRKDHLLAESSAELAHTAGLLDEVRSRVGGGEQPLDDAASEQISRAEAQRAEAVRANEAKSQLLSTLSHELRTPLNTIAGHTQLLEMELHGPITGGQRDALERIENAQRHLISLVNDVLSFAQLETGRVEYRIVSVDVAAVIAGLAPMVEPQLAAKNLGYSVEIAPDMRRALADEEKLRQVLLNLLSNAAKFTPEGGRITIDACARDEHPNFVFVRVTDTGVGVPRALQEDIFDPFVQVRPSRARLYEGTGLGLATSRDMARGMGGDIRARSDGVNGSTFTVALRRAASEDDAQ